MRASLTLTFSNLSSDDVVSEIVERIAYRMNYQNDSFWKSIQGYLPSYNRLSHETEPSEYFICVQNGKMHIDHYKVENPKARIILFHGVGGNGRLLSFIAVPLMKSGYEVVCPDMPPYGYSQYKGVVTYDLWVKCGAEIVNSFQQDNVPVFLFGLSAGGMLAYQVANECEDISGIIATCILDQRNKYVTKQTARSPVLAVIGNALIPVAGKIAGSIKIPMKMVVNMKAITNNQQLAEILMKDKRSSGTIVPLAFIQSMLHPVIKTEPEAFTACPFLLVHPGDDRWTDIKLSRLFYDRLSCEKELHILDGAGHFPIEEAGLKQLEKVCADFLGKHSN